MGRHKRMAASAAVKPPHPVTAPCRVEVGPDLADVPAERRAYIEGIVPKSMSAEAVELLRPWVVWCVTRAPFTAHQTDHKRVGQTYALLAEDAQLHGNIEPRRAFRHSAVMDHLARRQKSGLKGGSLNAIRSNLFAIGRRIAPEGYPPPRVGSNRVHVRPAATDRQVRVLEAAAGRLPGVDAMRLRVILALTTHAGARANELTQVRGRDIIEERIDGQQRTLVRLVSTRSRQERFVPILNPVVAARLVEQARAAGESGPLLGTPGNMKNAVNKVFSVVRNRHGVRVEVTAEQLRGYYITKLAQAAVPAATLMYLTDLGNSHSLYEYTRDLPPLSRAAQVRVLAGALR